MTITINIIFPKFGRIFKKIDYTIDTSQKLSVETFANYTSFRGDQTLKNIISMRHLLHKKFKQKSIFFADFVVSKFALEKLKNLESGIDNPFCFSNDFLSI